MQLKREKYIDLVMYILTRCYSKKNMGKTVLSTIMYFADFNYFELYSKLITKETYIKSKKGVKPKHLQEVTQDLIGENQLFLRKEPYYNRTIHRFYPTVIPNCRFSKNEQEIIDLTIKQLSNNNATEITRYAKKDPPLHIAEFGENLDCRYVFSRNKTYSMRKNKLKK